MKANFSYVIAIIALAAVCWLGAGLLWGWRGPVLDIARFWVLLIGSLLLGWALVHSTRKLAAGVWMAAGLLLMVLLSLPFSTFTNIFPWQGDGFFLSSISFTLIVLFCAALIVAALLIASGLDLTSAWRRADSPAGGEEQRRVSPRNLGYVSLFFRRAPAGAGGL